MSSAQPRPWRATPRGSRSAVSPPLRCAPPRWRTASPGATSRRPRYVLRPRVSARRSIRRRTSTALPTIAAVWRRSRRSGPCCRPQGDGSRSGRSRDEQVGLGRGERRADRARGAHPAPARPLPPRRPRAYRNAHRLRHRKLRGVHGAPGRRAREELHAARGAGRRSEANDRRGPRGGRRADGAPAVLQRAPRPPVRLLHAGDAHERNGAAGAKSAPLGGGCPLRAPGQHLPLYGLREHRRGDRGRREQQMTVVEETTTLRKGFVGQSIPRKEDRRLVQGQGTFFDDVRRHGMGYVHFVRSPYAHAKIVSIDVAKALELEGVYGTITGDEVAIHTDPFFEMSVEPGGNIKDYALAVGRVRHMGEPVAAVAAATRELARDAAELIEVEYDELPVLVDAAESLKDEVVLHDDAGSNVVWSGVFDWGDVDAALAEADHVVKIDKLHFHRFSSTPLECAGALVEYDKGTSEWTLHCNHQMPGVGAIWMAPALRVGIDKLRFVTQDIGGGFGNKICLHPQYVVLCLLARKLGRPVQWTEWRTDQHTANAHGNERWFLDVEVGVMADGTMTGFKVKALDDCGAFPRYEPLGCIIWAQVTPGLYAWRNIRVDFTQACTNKAPVSPNRGYSRMQHLWLTERIIDIVAAELGLDPVEVRKRNYVKAEQMPYETPNGCVYDSGDYARSLDLALELIGHDRLEERRKDAAARGKLLGFGIGSTLDSGTNNFGQSTLLNPDLQFSGNNEAASVKLDIFGEVVVTLGTVPQGQGHETTAAQVVGHPRLLARPGERASRP